MGFINTKNLSNLQQFITNKLFSQEKNVSELSLFERVEFIYTPKMHRRKGYAKKLLHEIKEYYTAQKSLIFSPVNKEIMQLYKNAGWSATGGTLNTDGTINMFPPSCARQYWEKLIYEKEDNKTNKVLCINDTTSAILILENYYNKYMK